MIVGCLIGGAAVVLFGVENVDAIPKSGIAAMVTVALFVAPAIRLSSFVMAGELNLKPVRRWVAKALPVMK
jgi:tetrahydromethanopterin S-methyltransferase subunit D